MWVSNAVTPLPIGTSLRYADTELNHFYKVLLTTAGILIFLV